MIQLVRKPRGDIQGRLTIPPQRLLTSTGTLVKMVVLVVTKMRDTAVMLMSDVASVLIQLVPS